jgi:hypothetical protein
MLITHLLILTSIGRLSKLYQILGITNETMMAFPLKGVNNLTGIYQCGKDSRSALDIRKLLELKGITVQESHRESRLVL